MTADPERMTSGHEDLFTRDRIADYWNDLYARPTSLFDHTMLQRRDYTVAYITARFGTDAKILDLGCGAGVLTERLLARGYTVTSGDASPDMVDLARQRLSASPNRSYRLLCANIMDLPFADGEFDLVVCLGVFGYFDDVDRALSEVRRVIRPGGTFFMSVRNKYNTHLSDLVLFPFRLMRVLVTLMRERFGAETRARSQNAKLRIEIRQRPGHLIQGFTQRGFSLRLFDGFGYGPVKLLGKEPLPPRVSMAISDFLDRTFRSLKLHNWSRWLADVSMYAFTVEGERSSKSGKHLA